MTDYSTNSYGRGDVVSLQFGNTDSVITGTLKGGDLFVGDSKRTLYALLVDKWTITMHKEFVPEVVLPTEPGTYATYVDSSRPQIIHKLNDGRWANANQNYYMTDKMVAHCLPLTRLEPVSETAKKVLDRVNGWWAHDEHRGLPIFLSALRAEFGVIALTGF